VPITKDTHLAEVVTTAPFHGPRGFYPARLAGIGLELDRLRSWAPSGALALLDQGLISGSNFVLGVALARWGGPASYGAYMVMFAAFLLIANVYQAILLEPSVVLAFSLFPSNNAGYVRVLLRMHAIFSVCFAALAGLLLALAPGLGIRGPLVNALTGLLFACPCVLLFWLARTFAYLEFSPGKALAGSMAYFTLLAAGLAVANINGGLTPLRAYLCSACAAAAASACLLLRYRHGQPSAEREPSLRDVWVRHWKYGRWGLGTVGVAWAQTNSLSFTSGYFLGLSGVGGLNALVGIQLPMLQVLSAVTRITLPRLAQRFTLYGAAATHRPVLRLAAALTALTTAYWLALTVAHRPLFRLVYGERFMAYAYLIPVISLFLIAWGVVTACDIAFNSIQQPQASFHVKMLAVAITVPVSTAMSWRFGLPGASIAVPACSMMTALCMALKLRSVWRREPASARQAAD
jgi:O-antigen/teichoic acid export membrane protein